MAGILDFAVGIQNAADARRKQAGEDAALDLKNRILAEDIRSNQSRENYQNRSLLENMALRRQHDAEMAAAREETNKARADALTMRRVNFRPVGAPVTQDEMAQELDAGVPSSLYQKGPASYGRMSEDTSPEAPQGPTMDQPINWGGSQTQLDAQQRIKDAELRAQQTDQDRDAQRALTAAIAANSNALARQREDRITGWGPPTVVIADPNSPGRNVVTTRANAVGQQAPVPAGVQTQVIQNEATDTQMDDIQKLFDSGGKDRIGPAAGRMNTFKQIVPNSVLGAVGASPTDETFNNMAAASQTLMNQITRANSGQAVSKAEETRMLNQVPNVNDKPEVWQAKFNQTRKNIAYLKGIVSRSGSQSAPATGGGGPRRIRYDSNGNPIP